MTAYKVGVDKHSEACCDVPVRYSADMIATSRPNIFGRMRHKDEDLISW